MIRAFSKRTFVRLICTSLMLPGVFIPTGCEKDKPDEEHERPTCKLTVNFGNGIQSNYKPGVYTYDTGMLVNYFFREGEDYINLVVTLDGKSVTRDSSFLIRSDHVLSAIAEQKTLWKYDTPLPAYFSAPAVGPDKTIYFTTGMYSTQQGKLYAMNPDGSLKWSYSHTTALYSPVIDGNGNIYLQDVFDKVTSISSSGQVRWSFSNYPTPNTQNVGQRCPAIGPDGTVYVASDGLYALDPNTGLLKWVFFQRHSTKASPAVGPDGTVYAVFSQDYIAAVNPDGSEKWNNAFEYEWEMSFSTPAVDKDGTIYFTSEARYEGTDISNVYAFNADGTLKWKYPVENERWIRASPVIDGNGDILVATKANELANPAQVIKISPAGQKVWSFTIENVHVTPDDIYSTPSIGNDGLIYYAAETGYLYVLNPDGTLYYSYDIRFSVNWSSPAITNDGILYLAGMFGGNNEGRLAAIKISSTGYANSPWPRFRHDNMNSGRF